MDPLSYNLLGAVVVGAMDVVLLAGILLLVLCSAFFSSAETAFSMSNSIRLHNYAEEKKKGARKALYIVENYEKTLITILVGNNLVNIASTTICAMLFVKFILNPALANLLNTVVMTIVILIFGEITPKCIAKQNPEKIAMRYSGIMFVLMKIMIPITWPFFRLQKSFNKKSNTVETPTVTEEELESIIDTMEEEGVIDGDNADIIQNAIKIGDVTAYDIMTPRVDVVCANIETSQEDIEEIYFANNYSRLPIYSETRDNIVGVLNQKDFYTAIIRKEKFNISKLMMPAIFVSENIKVDDLIKKMQKTKCHLMVVLDEHGGTSGIVTMEDCLESMVGEIYDEHDEVEMEMITKEDENTYLLNPDISIEDLFDTLEIEHLPKTEYKTLSGFLFDQSEQLVKENGEIVFKTIDDSIDKEGTLTSRQIEMKFIVTQMDGNRIKQVRLIVKTLELE